MTITLADGLEAPAVRVDGTAALPAAVSAGVAGLIHLALVPEHLAEWWVYGAFFVAVAWTQGLLAWSLLRRSERVSTLLMGIASTVGVIGVYVLSRTSGLPLVPPPGTATATHAEHGIGAFSAQIPGSSGEGMAVMPGTLAPTQLEGVGLFDGVTLVAELALVVLLVGMLPDRVRAVTTNVMLAGGVVVLLVRTSLLS
jgi:hypothetical protein